MDKSAKNVAKMGGTIGVKSEPGVGSVFKFTLPSHETTVE